MRTAVVTGLLVAALSSPGCGTATPAAPLVPRIEYQREGQAKALTAATSSRPLVVEWPAAERARLEASARRGLVVVRYDDTTMEVLSRCAAPGAYAYTPTTPQREGVRIRDEDELRANLPLGAASLASELARKGQLSVDLHIVGTYETGDAVPPRDALSGDCDGATHVVVALTTGAFELYAGGAASVGGDVAVGGAGLGGGSRAQRELLSSAGELAACSTSQPTDVAPPFGCGALLRVEVAHLPRDVGPSPSPAEPSPGSTPPAPSPSVPVAPGPPAPASLAAPSGSSPGSGPDPRAGEAFGLSGEATAGIVIGSLLLVSITAGIIAAAVVPDAPQTTPAPAGLGRAAVSWPGGASWAF